MAKYKLTTTDGILRGDALIPADPANRDYQDYLQWVADGNTPDAAASVPLPQQAAAELATRIGNGMALTCTGNAALNATYALDDVSTTQISNLGYYANAFNTFPGGSTQPYPDIGGTPHTFTVAQFVAFFQAVATLVSGLTTQAGVMAHGGSPSWPSQSRTIA